MKTVIDSYKSSLLVRYDKDIAIPYYSPADFVGLKHEKNSFNNSDGINISYFTYWYDGYKEDEVIIFCTGIGPGHEAHFPEINSFCQAGYKVIALDYTGCGSSGGERLNSLFQPTRDVNELINHLKLKERIIVIGHSLGGFTALNVINMNPTITKAVIISPFIDIASLMVGYTKFMFLAKQAERFERENNIDFKNHNNWEYLKNSGDSILFIHSIDDKVVNFKHNTKKLLKLKNPNLKFYICNGKNHNPTYTKEAVKYMNQSLDGYYRLLKQNGVTDEMRKEYFKDISIDKMTEQDIEIRDLILEFLNN